MSLKPKAGMFLAFAAAFAALAGFVFWGVWSCDLAPVMPDCPVSYPDDFVARWLNGWCANGKFTPFDLRRFLFSPYLWQELQYALAAFLSALGLAYWLKGRGLCRAAAYGAGLLLGFSGYWFSLFSAGHLGWFEWMAFGVFAFGLIDRTLEKNKLRHPLLLGAVVAWASFYQPDLWLLFTIFTFFYFVFRAVIVWRRLSLKAFALKVALAAAAFFLIGAPSFRSAFVNDLAGRDKQIEESKGSSLTAGKSDDDEARWIFATNWSLPPDEALEFFIPRLNGDTSCMLTLAAANADGRGTRQYTGRLGCPKQYEEMKGIVANYRQHSLYVGLVTCLLALLSLLSTLLPRRLPISQSSNPAIQSKNRKIEESKNSPIQSVNRSIGQSVNTIEKSKNRKIEKSTILFLAVSALVTMLLSFGRYCPWVYSLWYKLPLGDYLRAPVKWHHLTEFLLAALAGYGLQSLRAIAGRFTNGAPLAVTHGTSATSATCDPCDSRSSSINQSLNTPIQSVNRSIGQSVNKISLLLFAVALLGAVDLARVDRLYMAPQPVKREFAPQMCRLPATGLPQLPNELTRQGIRLAGVYRGYRQGTQSADVALLSVPRRPEGAYEPPPADTAAIALGIVSLLASLCVTVLSAASVICEGRARKRSGVDVVRNGAGINASHKREKGEKV